MIDNIRRYRDMAEPYLLEMRIMTYVDQIQITLMGFNHHISRGSAKKTVVIPINHYEKDNKVSIDYISHAIHRLKQELEYEEGRQPSSFFESEVSSRRIRELENMVSMLTTQLLQQKPTILKEWEDPTKGEKYTEVMETLRRFIPRGQCGENYEGGGGGDTGELQERQEGFKEGIEIAMNKVKEVYGKEFEIKD